jgi:hypothetical protein
VNDEEQRALEEELRRPEFPSYALPACVAALWLATFGFWYAGSRGMGAGYEKEFLAAFAGTLAAICLATLVLFVMGVRAFMKNTAERTAVNATAFVFSAAALLAFATFLLSAFAAK